MGRKLGRAKFIRLPAVKDRTGYSKPTIYRKMADGTFPKCRKLGDRAVGWLEHEVDAWIASREVA